MDKYRSEYTNEYGEEWIFEYDYSTNQAAISGSDVDWEVYPVKEGMALDLILNKGEINWLRRSWFAALASKPQNTYS